MINSPPTALTHAGRPLSIHGVPRISQSLERLNRALEMHEQLGTSLARFTGTKAAQVLTTGFLINQAVIAPLVSRGDIVIIDRLVHASILDGMRLGFGKARGFKHNDVESLRRNSRWLFRHPKGSGL